MCLNTTYLSDFGVKQKTKLYNKGKVGQAGKKQRNQINSFIKKL